MISNGENKSEKEFRGEEEEERKGGNSSILKCAFVTPNMTHLKSQNPKTLKFIGKKTKIVFF